MKWFYNVINCGIFWQDSVESCVAIIWLCWYEWELHILIWFIIQVAETAHLLWNNEHILNLIMQNRQVILPLVLSAIVHNGQSHWNQAVLNLTQNILLGRGRLGPYWSACSHLTNTDAISGYLSSPAPGTSVFWPLIDILVLYNSNINFYVRGNRRVEFSF